MVNSLHKALETVGFIKDKIQYSITHSLHPAIVGSVKYMQIAPRMQLVWFILSITMETKAEYPIQSARSTAEKNK